MTAASLADELLELYSRVPRGMRLGLDAMRAAAVTFGHPEESFASVHVAGTNGKGSTTAMIESMARAEGLRTGRFTSPHLTRFAERIAIGGEPIDDRLLSEVLHDANEGAKELSFFETATLAAFLAFREMKVDLAVVEVGIGGRLDATNILPSPRVTAITRIALDHMDRLGATLPEIAREKAGIAKRGVPLVLGPIEGPELRAIEIVASEAGAEVVRAAPHPLEGKSSLAGRHQRDNARVALAVAEHLHLSSASMGKGLVQVKWPGRLERVNDPSGTVLLDAAHNADGVETLLAYLDELDWKGPLALVFGTLADKDGGAMLDRLAPRFNSRVYVAPKGRAATAPEEHASNHPGEPAPSVSAALLAARRSVGQAGLVVITGSIYLVGEARTALLGLTGDPIVAL